MLLETDLPNVQERPSWPLDMSRTLSVHSSKRPCRINESLNDRLGVGKGTTKDLQTMDVDLLMVLGTCGTPHEMSRTLSVHSSKQLSQFDESLNNNLGGGNETCRGLQTKIVDLLEAQEGAETCLKTSSALPTHLLKWPCRFDKSPNDGLGGENESRGNLPKVCQPSQHSPE
jgi:hypothetical protein